MPADESKSTPTHFIEDIIDEELASGVRGGRVVTRFPPEPNGYLHIGHVKSICLNFGLALKYGGRCHLRFDDTNPTKEEQEYVDSIMEDVRWLGFDWGEHLYYASDYFDQLYEWAVLLIKGGKAYVCDQTPEQMRVFRGTLTRPGHASPFRNRGVEENLDLFERMKNGEFPDGSRTLRAKIDMASPNLNMRDPVLYRILRATHHRTGDKWCIYPMYDWAHGQSDWIEGVTHSICTLEFENHRPLYDWFIETIRSLGGKVEGVPYRPRQIEFAKLNLTYTVLSKRRLIYLVRQGYVRGWDDPRMPTICGLRRRGYTPESLRELARRVGVAKFNSTVDVTVLENCLRDDLNKRAPRVMGVLRPLKLVIDNYPEGRVEELDAVNNPEDPSAGVRKVPFSRVLYIEQDDFREVPPPRYFRLFPGQEVRLRYAYFVRCTGVEKDPVSGAVTAVHCTYDPATRGGDSPDGRKVKGTIHWVSAAHAVDCEIRLYDHLFNRPDPSVVDDPPTGVLPAAGREERRGDKQTKGQEDKGIEDPRAAGSGPRAAADADPAAMEDELDEYGGPPAGPGTDQPWLRNLNPHSLEIIPNAKLEPGVLGAPPGTRYQFERHGYFCVDPDSTPARLVFNRTVTLKDTWAKIEKKQ
ncbi:MAG: glutamine--tRNA ligase/YqeY domain fusion protein [Phycisphaerae bacterium]|jgi:glutaminyl-tRNA synthetase